MISMHINIISNDITLFFLEPGGWAPGDESKLILTPAWPLISNQAPLQSVSL